MDDIEAIKNLKARYFRFLDTKDWAGWGDLFTADASLDVDTAVSTRGADPRSIPTVRGRAEIVKFVRSVVDDCITVHHGHMPEIELSSPTSARGVWAMEDIVDKVGVRLVRGYGHYHETYRREADGQWRIATLRLTRLRLDIYSQSAE